MEIKQTSEKDFKEKTIIVDDELYKLAETVYEYFDTNMTGFFFSEDGKKIKIRHQVKERYPGEKDTHAYIITVEKIPYE